MRRLLVTLLCALVVVPTALAATRAAGDGVLELRSVSGTVAIGKEGQPARGILWGQLDKGRLVVVDPVAGDGQAFVSGWDKRTVLSSADDGTPTVIAYTGTDAAKSTLYKHNVVPYADASALIDKQAQRIAYIDAHVRPPVVASNETPVSAPIATAQALQRVAPTSGRTLEAKDRADRARAEMQEKEKSVAPGGS